MIHCSTTCHLFGNINREPYKGQSRYFDATGLINFSACVSLQLFHCCSKTSHIQDNQIISILNYLCRLNDAKVGLP